MMMSSAGEMWVKMGSTLASFYFFWDMIRRYCPYELQQYLEKFSIRFVTFFNPNVQVSVHEFTGGNLKPQKAYAVVEAYLSQKSSKSAKRLKLELVKNSNMPTLTIDEHENILDEFRGVKVWWAAGTIAPSTPATGYRREPDKRYYKLTFHKKYRDFISDTYLEHVIKTGKEIKARKRQRKLYTNGKYSTWSHVVFRHPATFETLAMEPEKKQEIVEDLLTFRKSKDFYSRIGKAWKRGYLLYGPPGTGKSTMIAAIANLLDYDVYDLELTSVTDNTDLRRLLIETTSKSVIVIEDIDCSLELTGQRKKNSEKSAGEGQNGKKELTLNEKKEENGRSKVTLSGLLNFIDGLWSACGGERIIVFTTNHVEKLDPALTRRGRMDKHIELSYCNFEGFKVLAKNYLGLETHFLFEQIERLLKETNITPADVAENLMPKSAMENAETRLLNLIQVLEEAKEQAAVKKDEEEVVDTKLVKDDDDEDDDDDDKDVHLQES